VAGRTQVWAESRSVRRPWKAQSAIVPSLNRDLGDWFENNASQVQRDLDRYFGGKPKDLFTGRWFDQFAAIGDPNRFEASDIMAADALLVGHEIPPDSAAKILITEPDRFNSLLRDIPWSQDIWQVRRLDLDVGSKASDLHELLCSDAVPGIGWVTAGKLLAAKRPRLIPILDKEVQAFLQPRQGLFWVSMYDELSDDCRRKTIADVCRNAPPHVSLLRRMDAALWMAAKRENPRQDRG
jgi:Family of unknown function (DUF6308)